MIGMTQPHVEPPLITLIKEKNGGKSDIGFVELKVRRDPTSSTSDVFVFNFFCFTMANRKSFCCLFVTSIRPLQRQGCWRRTKTFNTFVLLYAGKRFVSFTRCLLTWKLQKP